MVRKVNVMPYQCEWPEQFQSEARALSEVFGDLLLSIHHFGSTAIPGISAKPIIDMMIIVRDIRAVDALDDRLRALGYLPVGEYGIAGRRFFYKGTHDSRTHHLHVYQRDNPHILRHLAFRDYMRAHPPTASAYSQLKEGLARQFPEDMDRYIEGKNNFVKEQEQRALEWFRRQK